MKNVIIIGPAYPLRGGLASFNERLAMEFIAQGYEVSIYTFSLQYPHWLFPGKTQFSPDPPPEGLKINVRINSVNPFNWWTIGREIRNLKPDIVVCRFWLPFMGPSLGTVLRMIRQNKHTRIISIIDNIIPHEKRPGDKLLTQYFVNSTDAFVVMSRSVEKEMEKFTSRQPVRYIPHPIFDNYGPLAERSEALAYLSLAQEPRYLLFFGFIRHYKGLDLLIKAMGDDRIRQLNLRLIIAGEYYSNRQYYEELIKETKVEDLIILRTDYIPNDEVRYYFGAADLVVQPYKSATQSGISQLACHFEKPMVVTNVGGLPETVNDKESGYVVEVDERAVADAIVDFFASNRSSQFVQGVIQNKERFSWKEMVKGIESLAGNALRYSLQ